jgi:hypothetical protein
VRRALIAPPQSRLGAITPTERETVIRNSIIHGHYEQCGRSRIGLRDSSEGRRRRQARSIPAPVETPRQDSPSGNGGGLAGDGGRR